MRDEEHILKLPVRKRKRSFFSMTPLADAMFQLLIFFMLSSNLTPYSLLVLRSAQAVAAPQTGTGGGGTESDAAPLPQDVQLWNVKAETVEVVGDTEDWAFEDLPALAERIYESSDLPRVMLQIDRTAQVQSLATVLEILNSARIEAIQIAVPAAGGTP